MGLIVNVEFIEVGYEATWKSLNSWLLQHRPQGIDSKI